MPFAPTIAATLLLSSALGAVAVPERPEGPRGAVPTITPETAVAIALNTLAPIDDGIRLTHPRHIADFTPSGVRFVPQHGGPVWQWSLADAASIPICEVEPVADANGRIVRFDRGPIVEEYHLRAAGIEQRFVIAEPIGAPGEDLVISGSIDCAGTLESGAEGWLWRTAEGVVSLGHVYVFDARNMTIDATMEVTQSGTRIVVEGDDLARAAYPVTVDPEIGTNDFRLSTMGPDGDIDYDALRPAVAYNSVNNEFLVVWSGDDNAAGVTDGEFEIFGQRISAATGLAVGANDFRISDMGPDGDGQFDAVSPDVAYSATSNEYLVVWEGDDNAPGLIDGANEVFGQRIAGATGAAIGTNDFRISDMGIDSDTLLDAERPAVAWNSVDNLFLVVWAGDDDTAPLVNGESEIFGQLIAAGTGAATGTNDFRISDMGPNGNGNFDALNPDVAYNATNNEFFTIWQGDDNTAPLVDGETEIFGQRIAGATGAEVGTNDARLSDMGTNGDSTFDAEDPAVAWSSTSNQYLVVWSGDDNSGLLVNGESEIFGQLVSGATGAATGANDFRVSSMGVDGDVLFDALAPRVAHDTTTDEFVVTWEGDDSVNGVVNGESEIFVQWVNASGALVESDDVRVSDMGQTNGTTIFNAFAAAVATGGANGSLVVWQGDDDLTGTMTDEEFEIYAQRLTVGHAEVGTNDFRVSDMGPDGDENFDAETPAVAYNSVANEYLVVWAGDDLGNGLVDDEFEIFGQRVNAATGLEVGVDDFRISDMGTNGDVLFSAIAPSVAYNPVANEYLVVWQGEENIGLLVEGEFEIFGQRLTGAGVEIGANDFRISDMGPDGDATFDAVSPDVAFNPITNEYLVVWEGDDDTAPLVNNDFEIFGQRLVGATGAAIGTNDFRVSDMGVDGDGLHDAETPAVACNTLSGEWLVVWAGDDSTLPLVDGESEIFVQRLTLTGAAVGTNDLRISDMGPNGDAAFDAFAPDIAFNSVDNQFLVVWEADDNLGGQVDGEVEIFAQRLSGASGAEIGANDVRISRAGPDANTLLDAVDPAVSFNAASGEYFVVWSADGDAGLLDGEFEIFGQRLDGATGAEVGDDDARLSDMGTVDGDAAFDAITPAIAFAGTTGEALIVWSGDDGTGLTGDDEFEIVAQRYLVEIPCPGDLDGDGAINATDLSVLLGAWGSCAGCAADISGDGSVDAADLSILLGAWGPC
jgi:hypothetical protein